MNHQNNTNYTVIVHDSNGNTQELDEWFSLPVAKKILAKACDVRMGVVNSPVAAIEIVDFNRNQIQIVKF